MRERRSFIWRQKGLKSEHAVQDGPMPGCSFLADGLRFFPPDRWRGDGMPPPPSSCQDNKDPKSPLSFAIAHPHLSSTSPYVGHDSVGCGGFSCQHLTAKNIKKEGGQHRRCFSKDQKNSESARDITPLHTHTHTHPSSRRSNTLAQLYISGEAATEPLK